MSLRTQNSDGAGPQSKAIRIEIEAGDTSRHYWTDMWRYRELLHVLAWRDLSVRYKQTVIGIAWGLIRPIVTMGVFVVFRRLFNVQTTVVPEAILVLAAILPWQLFSSGLSETSASLINNANLVTKVYFPRLIIPLVSVATALVDFFIALALFVVLMLWYGFAPGWQILVLPLFVCLTCALVLGLGLLFAALNVKFRDFRYVVPFIIQFGIFASPIAFTTTDVPEQWRTLYALNPLVGIIDGFRWSLLRGQTPLDPYAVSLSVLLSLALLLLGVWYFRRVERGFADVI